MTRLKSAGRRSVASWFAAGKENFPTRAPGTNSYLEKNSKSKRLNVWKNS